MKIILLSFLYIILTGCGSEVVEATDQIDSLERISEKQKTILFDRLNKFPDETNVAIAMIRNGNVAYFGVTRENGVLKNSDNEQAVYEIGSISKIMTSTLLANAVVNEGVMLSDNINSNYDFPFKNNKEITYESLANHTSGLPRLPSSMIFGALFNMDNPYKDFSGADMEEYLQEELDMDSTKKEKSAYSNLGAGLLAYSLEKRSGKTFEELLQEQIFTDLNMTSSTVVKKKIKERLIPGRDEDGDITPNWDFQALAGAGAVFSNVGDLAKFAISQFDTTNQVAALTRKKTFSESETRHLGLGWVIFDQDDGNEWVWHNGGTGGYRSSMVVDVKNQNAVIVLSNISSSHNLSSSIDKVCFDLMNTLYEFDERLDDVAFLEGTWKVKGKKRYESWDIVAGGTMKGIGFKAEMGSNDIFEYLTLRVIDDVIVYEARVPDQNDGRTIQFKQNPNIADFVSFENPDHDFPNKIQYKVIDEITINVRVLGNDDQGLNYDLIKQENR